MKIPAILNMALKFGDNGVVSLLEHYSMGPTEHDPPPHHSSCFM